MVRRTSAGWPTLALLLALPAPAPACSLCGALALQRPTFRQEAAQPTARLVLIGTARNARLNAGGTGTTDFLITHVFRSDPALGNRKVLELPRYLPISDPKDPPRYLLFCDVFEGQIDPFRGVPVQSADLPDYVKKAMTLDSRDPAANLAFFFRYLEHPDKEIAQDAFLEFAKATDQDLGQAARRLSPDKLRRWLKDPATPPERLSLYALLLGGCGGPADAALLRDLLRQTGERYTNAYDGLLGGYIRLRPREGWDLALATLRDGRRPLQVRLAVVRMLRFYHGWQPRESRALVLGGLRAMIAQGELADLAVEDLRQWQMWDLTREVLALYGRKGYDAPIMQRALVRYALSCRDDPAARSFLAERRRQDPDLVREVEESLEFEKGK
jgi:hypothetical protein